MAIIPGDYILIQAAEKGARYPAEVIRVIDYDYEMYYRANNVWPKEYDIGGCVERRAEKIQRAEAEAEMERKRRKLCRRAERASSDSDTDTSDSSKKKKKKKDKTKKCRKRSKHSDKTCLAETPLFVHDDLPLIGTERKKTSARKSNNMDCSTNTGRYTNLGTGQPNANIGQMNTKVGGSNCATTGCCNTSCCGKNTATTGTDPFTSGIVVSRELMPPLYGQCTPWLATKKELKKMKYCNQLNRGQKKKIVTTEGYCGYCLRTSCFWRRMTTII